jgi:hypothetical protein
MADAQDQRKVTGFRLQESSGERRSDQFRGGHFIFTRKLSDARESREEDLKPDACSLKPTNRADDGLRTRDLQLGKLALYQLSYVRVGGYFSTPGVALVT